MIVTKFIEGDSKLMVHDKSLISLSNRKKVCVLVTTYNHEKFIPEAINSVLIQEVKFEYEVVIIEDCSTDRTRDIVIDFQRSIRIKCGSFWRRETRIVTGHG